MPKEKRYLDSFSSADRKKVPMYAGLMAYFPDACAAVAEHSYKGNEKHNPGEPLHHARGKSMDHTDCIMRHVAAGPEAMDGDSLDAVALAWRALAYCQEVLERKYALTLPEGATDPRAFPETNSLVGPNGEQAPQEAPVVQKDKTWASVAEEAKIKRAADSHQRDIADPHPDTLRKTPNNGPWPSGDAFRDFDHECIPGN